MRGAHSLALLWSSADLAIGGFLGNWAGFISLIILSLSFVWIKFSLNCAFYIRHPRRTILLHLQTPEFCRNSKPLFFFLHEPKMPPRSWTSQLGQRKQKPKIFPPFNRARKKTLLLRPGTVAAVDCVRPSMSPQTLIKNVQELAKEEGEESEAKLREAIEILEGATFWRTIF